MSDPLLESNHTTSIMDEHFDSSRAEPSSKPIISPTKHFGTKGHEEDEVPTAKMEPKQEFASIVTPRQTRASFQPQNSPSQRGTPISTPPDLLAFRARKAGHENVDKAKVEAIVKNLTENSAYHKRKKLKWKDRSGRTQQLKYAAKEFRASSEKIRRSQYMVDNNIIPELEFRRLKGRVQVCVDFDCFYAQVEAFDDPSLIGVPHAVTMGTGSHCTLATTSYEARARGVKGGMAAFIGQEICPELILKPPRMGRYAEISKQMGEVLVNYDPEYSMGSLDEAFLDITHLVTEERPASDIVNDLRNDVRKHTGLTISAGCAPCLMIAKIAADYNKPDGQTVLLPEEGMNEREYVINFMGALPLIKVPGIGPATESTLENGLGYKIVSDIYKDRAVVAGLFTPFKTRFLLRIALGISCPWTEQYYDKGFIRKGIGSNRTFDRVSDEEGIVKRLQEIASYLEKEVEYAGGVGGQTFTVKLKNTQFESFRKSITLPTGAMLCTADDFILFARKIVRDNLPMELRRIGMKLHKITWKKRPKGSIKQYLKVEDEDAEDLLEAVENSKTANQILQARERAKKYYYEQFIVGDNNSSVHFNSSSCMACKTDGKDCNVKHIYRYSCPICHSKCFKYLSALNEHLDKCDTTSIAKMIKQETKDVKKITSFFKRSKEFGSTKRGIKRDPDSIGPPPKRARSSSNERTKSDMDGAFTCPVCNICRFEDNIALNSHVDECLNAKYLETNGTFKEQTVKEEVKSAILTPRKKERCLVPKKSAVVSASNPFLGLSCPVCNVCLFDDNNSLNAHIDECLNVNSDIYEQAVESTKTVATKA